MATPESFPPQLLSATNSAAGVIDVKFSQKMTLDAVFRRVQNFAVTLVEDTPAVAVTVTVTVTEVKTNDTKPTEATVLFTGGGSLYLLTITGVSNSDGDPIDPDFNSAVFDIGLPGGEVEPQVHIFDTVFGPLGIAQRPVTRRTIDGLVINRALDLGVNEQLKHRLEALGAAIPLRSGKDGGRRT